MIIHVFSSTGNYPVEFANFVTSGFPATDHLFVFRKWNEEKRFTDVSKERVLKVTSKWSLIFTLTPLLRKADRVIFHSFPISIVLIYWVLAIRLIRKPMLAIYGTEIYWYNYVNHSPWNRIQEHLRKRIFSRFTHAITIIEKDFLLFENRYAAGAQHVQAYLPIPGNIAALEFRPSRMEMNNRITILLGNSSNPSNYHIEIIEILAKLPFAEDIHVICPLSYGDDSYAHKVEERGRDLFKDRFKGLKEFLQPDQYNEVLYSVDLAIMNHDRQQALGTIFMLLFIGKKVYLRSDNPAFDFFKSHALSAGSIEEIIPGSNSSNLVLTNEEAEQNHKIMKELLSVSHYNKMWSHVFKSND